jgi:hypothetical protein
MRPDHRQTAHDPADHPSASADRAHGAGAHQPLLRAASPMAQATVGKDGLLTVPVGIRRWLGLTPGTRLTVRVNAQGELVFRIIVPFSEAAA